MFYILPFHSGFSFYTVVFYMSNARQLYYICIVNVSVSLLNTTIMCAFQFCQNHFLYTIFFASFYIFLFLLFTFYVDFKWLWMLVFHQFNSLFTFSDSIYTKLYYTSFHSQISFSMLKYVAQLGVFFYVYVQKCPVNNVRDASCVRRAVKIP